MFEWRCSHDGLRHSPAGASVVSAGVSWTLGTEPAEQAYRDWFDARYDDGFEYGVSRHKMVYLHRYTPLAALAQAPHGSAGGLHDQSELLTQWALESWLILEANPLPRPA